MLILKVGKDTAWSL